MIGALAARPMAGFRSMVYINTAYRSRRSHFSSVPACSVVDFSGVFFVQILVLVFFAHGSEDG